MKRHYASSSNKNIIFRQLINKDINNLIENGFPQQGIRFKQTLIDKSFQYVGLKPFSKELVAYHTKEKQVIGFLQLNRHSNWLYSIKFAYTHPNFRKMGVASGLFKFAFSQARSEGGRKLFLNVDPTLTFIIELYKKMGFYVITKSFEVWAQVGVSKSLLQTESTLNEIDISSKNSRNFLFDICQRYLSDEWLKFFELNINNLINGFSGDFRRFFSKKAFVNNSNNSFVLFFRRPLSKIAFAELFAASDSEVPTILDGLLPILRDLGINCVSLKMFNITSDSLIQVMKKNEFYIYHSLCMGKSF